MEVLVATGIFAVGMVAVASIFPVAILLQKRTVNSINADSFAGNAVSLIESYGFDERYLENRGAYTNNAGVPVPDSIVTSVPRALLGNPGAGLDSEWTLLDRSFGVNEIAEDRAVWWVPLFFDDNPVPIDTSTVPTTYNRTWKVFVFIVQRDYNADYDQTSLSGDVTAWAIPSDDVNQVDGRSYIPGVSQITVSISGGRFNFTNTVTGDRIVRVGEQVLASDGNVYRVTEADATGIRVRGNTIDGTPTHIWAAHPGDSGQSSFVALVPIDDGSTVTPNNLIR